MKNKKELKENQESAIQAAVIKSRADSDKEIMELKQRIIELESSHSVILSKKETPQRKKVFLTSLSSLLLSPLVVAGSRRRVPYYAFVCSRMVNWSAGIMAVVRWWFSLSDGPFFFF